MHRSIALKIAKQLVALTLLFFLSPGLSAATADVLHLAIAGHTVDADEDAPREQGHEDRDPCSTEHHCSGAFHTCGCATPSAIPVAAHSPVTGDTAPVVADSRGLFTERATSSRDAVEGQFKPPRV